MALGTALFFGTVALHCLPCDALMVEDSLRKSERARDSLDFKVRGRNRPDARCRPPEDSSLRHTVLAVQGVFVDDDYLAKFELLEKYRPYFLDMFYLQMQGDVAQSEFFIPNGSRQVNLSQRTQRTFGCGAHQFRLEGSDFNSYACMAELMAIVRSKGPALYGRQPEGFLFLHADFWITPRFLTNKDTGALWGSADFHVKGKWLSSESSQGWGCTSTEDPTMPFHEHNVQMWEEHVPAVAQAMSSFKTKTNLRLGRICKKWSDMYFVPASVAETWIELSRVFVKHHILLEFAIGTFREMLVDTVPSAEIHGIIGSCCDTLDLEDIDNEANDAGHRFRLQGVPARRRISEIFDCN